MDLQVLSIRVRHEAGMISSYPKILALGHKRLGDILDGTVYIQEKIDGSQISFGLIDGILRARSRGAEIDLNAPEKMFSLAVKTILEIGFDLKPGWIFRGEYLRSPRHNTLSYERVPYRNIILFDVMVAPENYLDPYDLGIVAHHIGLECVPFYGQFEGGDITKHLCNALLEREPFLGGSQIEGIVIKNYEKFDEQNNKPLMAKVVSENFKETHTKSWKKRNPTGNDILSFLIDEYAVPARWEKAVQHLMEAGQLQGTPQDIGPLMKEVGQDLRSEEEERIKEILFKYYWKNLQRGVTRGLPEWYKDRLLTEVLDGS